jgi:hypothetical protein
VLYDVNPFINIVPDPQVDVDPEYPPGVLTAVYPVIITPPFDTGAE